MDVRKQRRLTSFITTDDTQPLPSPLTLGAPPPTPCRFSQDQRQTYGPLRNSPKQGPARTWAEVSASTASEARHEREKTSWRERVREFRIRTDKASLCADFAATAGSALAPPSPDLSWPEQGFSPTGEGASLRGVGTGASRSDAAARQLST